MLVFLTCSFLLEFPLPRILSTSLKLHCVLLLSPLFFSLTLPLIVTNCHCIQAVELAGIYDYQVNCNFDLALARNSWRVRANKLLGGLKKPTIQHIQQHLKEVLILALQWLTGILIFFLLLIAVGYSSKFLE